EIDERVLLETKLSAPSVAIDPVNPDLEDIPDAPDAEPDIEALAPEPVEEFKIVTRLGMSSRRVRVRVDAELLQSLERAQIRFKLN
ncbi:MAG TPA: hypothetical protein PLA69_10045, partial [Flavobacterium sp.]|nr:hypothetical protein [Flavobacterium sp.]